MCISAAILAAGALTAGGAVVASKGAGKAADAQVGAARDAAQLQNEQFQQSRADMQPFLKSGLRSQAALDYEMGLGDRPGPTAGQRNALSAANRLQIRDSERRRGVFSAYFSGTPFAPSDGADSSSSTSFYVGNDRFDTREQAQEFIDGRVSDATDNYGYQGFTGTPGYEFRVAQWRQAIERSAAARGGLNSGATMNALQSYGQGMAADEYGTYMNRLAAGAGQGQTQVNSLASLGANSAANQGNSLMQAGNARASGYANQANIFGGAASQIAGGIGNYIGGQGGSAQLYPGFSNANVANQYAQYGMGRG